MSVRSVLTSYREYVIWKYWHRAVKHRVLHEVNSDEFFIIY